jgi:hypothetical protein
MLLESRWLMINTNPEFPGQNNVQPVFGCKPTRIDFSNKSLDPVSTFNKWKQNQITSSRQIQELDMYT